MSVGSLLTSAFLVMGNLNAPAITCTPYQWQEVVRVDKGHKFEVCQWCNLGYQPNMSIAKLNQVVAKHKEKSVLEVFDEEDDDREGYIFSSKENSDLNNGQVELRSRNYAYIDDDEETAQFLCKSKLYKPKGRARYIDSLENEVTSKKSDKQELLVGVKFTMLLNTPSFVPIGIFENSIKKDMEKDLSIFATDLHEAIDLELSNKDYN